MDNAIQPKNFSAENFFKSNLRKPKPVSNEKTYWELRLERLKKRLDAEEKYLLEQQQLEDTGEKLAQRRTIQNLAIGLGDEVKPQMPITGVPASLLLSLL